MHEGRAWTPRLFVSLISIWTDKRDESLSPAPKCATNAARAHIGKITPIGCTSMGARFLRNPTILYQRSIERQRVTLTGNSLIGLALKEVQGECRSHVPLRQMASADALLLKVLLVVFLGAVEVCRRSDLRNDWAAKNSGFLESRFGCASL
jgi:hypothetical protein